ncbi:MAG: 23S rRNA (adenine(2503)-C(2))-methyltransferase RlmN [Armatimonadota bacterium]|nr:23S rRNA (adenine(2503)-C(2))-methyltransferase RlmN [Armatimonadota bacterium]
MELLGATTTELREFCEELNCPAFRGKQIAGWLYKKGVSHIDEMANLPKSLISKLNETATLSRSRIVAETTASDGVRKFLLELADGERIESVLLPYSDRLTACVSTQVGCAAGCAFCASAGLGLIRNLSAGEIVDQILTLQAQSGERITNVVYMGVGEPLLNYGNVVKSVRLLNEEVGISARQITVSTIGVIPRILKLAEEKLQITLAVSLHAPDDELRGNLIPLAGKYPLRELLRACRAYSETTGRRVTIEYMLLAGVNDSPHQAQRLVSLLKGMLCNVNLIPYNPVPNLAYKRPETKRVTAFREVLEQAGITVTQRFERGDNIAAACGQLRRSR